MPHNVAHGRQGVQASRGTSQTVSGRRCDRGPGAFRSRPVEKVQRRSSRAVPGGSITDTSASCQRCLDRRHPRVLAGAVRPTFGHTRMFTRAHACHTRMSNGSRRRVVEDLREQPERAKLISPVRSSPPRPRVLRVGPSPPQVPAPLMAEARASTKSGPRPRRFRPRMAEASSISPSSAGVGPPAAWPNNHACTSAPDPSPVSWLTPEAGRGALGDRALGPSPCARKSP